MERTPARRLVSTALATLALIATATLLAPREPAHAAGPTDALPDLVADPPTMPTFDDYTDTKTGDRNLLLRFNGYIHNAGAGALELRGSRATKDDPMAPLQRIYSTDGSSYRDVAMPTATSLQYATADGHNHWHVQSVAQYELVDSGRSSIVAPAMKVGFCMEDTQKMASGARDTPLYGARGGVTPICAQGDPNATSLVEGISAGWRDAYWRTVAFQWVVVSDVQPGDYWLREEVDPNDIVRESNETNPPAWSATEVTVPGYVAKAITAPPIQYGHTQKITLDADTHSSSIATPGPRAFKIVTPPAHGTLDVATGSSFTGPDVTYRPAAGYAGPDQFTYEALDSTSRYPLLPGTATVALTVATSRAPRVVIANAPSALQTGAGVQLHAAVSNDFPGVTWSVNGVDGGGAVQGTISASGFYRAPPAIPPGGHVTIAGRSASGASDQRTIAIVWRPPPGPSPGTRGSKKSKGILGAIATGVDGRIVAASVTPKDAGVVWITFDIGKHRYGSCRADAAKDRRFTCRALVPAGARLGRLKVVARLIRHHHVVARVAHVGAP